MATTIDINDYHDRIENEGITPQGKLPAAVWNALVEEVLNNKANISAVQNKVKAIESMLSGKYGYSEYRDGTIYYYDEQGGTVIDTLSLSGNIYTIDIGYTGSSVFSVLTGDTHKYLTIEPTTTLQTSIGGQSTPVTEAYDYVVAINTGSGYVNRISGNDITSATSFDIRPWIVVGTNMIRISVTGRTSHVTKTLTLTCTLTSLSLSCQHNWRTPWNEGEAYVIGGIYFAGAIQKTLHVALDGSELTSLAETFSPSENASTIAKSITIPANYFPLESGDASGQHTLEIWMTGTGVSTSHIAFNILAVATGETLPLICVNNVATTAINFAGNNLFDYYTLNADQVDVDVVVTAGGQTYTLPRQTNTNVEDGALNTFSTQLEVNTEETTGTVSVTVYPSAGGTVNPDGILMMTMGLDNSLAFLAASNPVFYFTAGTRSNGESDREDIKNVAVDPAESYEGLFTNMTWSTDGWATDSEGYKALVIPAGCTAQFPTLVPFSFADSTNGLTIEFMYRASVIADLDTPILRFTDIATGTSGTDVTVGVIVYPTKIRVLGSREQENLEQEVGLCEDTITHITLTLQKAYAGTSKNLVTLYVNGYPNVSFEYNVNSTFGNGALTIGQDSTDTYLYMMRYYDRALEGTSVLANFLNAVFSGVTNREAVRDKNNIITDTIQYALCKDKYNCFIVEPEDETQEIPSFYNDNKVMSTIRFEYAQHHDWDVKITHVPVDGQGTTSKKYFRWNLRGKLASNCEWYYTNGSGENRGIYNANPTFTGKKGYMDGGAGGGVHLKIERFTAKKNIASQPQGHKFGATAMYDDLYAQIGLKSELPNSNYRVAVWQYPFLGFRKRGDSYEFIGLYTAGPDKGCKVTFGYDADQYPMAMCIEGPNHAPRGTRFLHPWVNVTYEATQETLCFGGQEGWDDDFSAGYDSDDTSAAANILAMYVSEWKPAYDLVYHCSPYIAKLTEATLNGTAMGNTDAAALTAINANLGAFLAGTTRGEKNSLMSFYDSNYDIYYLQNVNGEPTSFVKLTREDGDTQDGLWNIKTYLGLTGSPTTDEIIAARAAKFKAEMGNYFSLDSTLYHKNFCMLIGAKDNDAKNSYPFKHLALSDGGRWMWKQDDLDSIFDTDNNGMATVEYGVEHGDTTSGVEIFQGCDSAFWTLIWRNYQPELRTMFVRMARGLEAIARAKGLVKSTDNYLHDYVMRAISYYFFDNTALYFPQIAYQEDRTFGYLTPWVVAGTISPSGTTYPETYNGVRPLTQALGDRYQDEKLWVERRIAYLFSKYRLGAFTGNNSGWGEMAFTLDTTFDFSIIPAIDLYPVGSLGGGTDIQAARTKAGQTATLRLPSDHTTGNYIKGVDWLASLGDLSGMALVVRTGTSTNIPFSVSAKRMEILKVGDATRTVLFNATSLSVTGPAFKVIDARRVTTLNTQVDLRNCPRLRQALFGGSSAPGLLLPVGSRVHEVSFPDNLQDLFLHSLNQLTHANITLSANALASIMSLYFYKCEQLNPFVILEQIMGTVGNSLTYVNMTWDDDIEVTTPQWNALLELAEDVNDTPKYKNVTYGTELVYDNENRAALSGAITVGMVYEDDYQKIVAAFPNLTVTAAGYYLKFEDQRVCEICAYRWGDTYNIQEVNGAGGVLGSGELEGNNDTLVYSDYMFAATYAIGAHGTVPATAARTVQYRVEIVVEGGRALDGENAPWDIATASAVGNAIFYPVQYGTTMSATALGTITEENWADPTFWASQTILTDGGAVGANARKYTALITTTNACQYLRLGIRAVAGTSISWKFVSVGVTKLPQGITQAQCAAVSSLGTAFEYNKIIMAFAELKLFIKIKSFNAYHFDQCFNLSKVRLAEETINVGSSFNQCNSIGTWNFYPDSLTTFNTCYNIYIDTMIVPPNVTSVANRAWSGSISKRVAMRWIVFEGDTPPTFGGNPFYMDYYNVKVFVPNDSVDAYKAVSQLSSVKSRIYPISDFETYFPGESYVRVP